MVLFVLEGSKLRWGLIVEVAEKRRDQEGGVATQPHAAHTIHSLLFSPEPKISPNYSPDHSFGNN